MNHEERRELKRHAAKALKEAKGFFLIVSNGNGMPTYFYDLIRLTDENENADTDIRVQAMQAAAGTAMGVLNNYEQELKARIEAVKIEAEKKHLVAGEAKSE